MYDLLLLSAGAFSCNRVIQDFGKYVRTATIYGILNQDLQVLQTDIFEGVLCETDGSEIRDKTVLRNLPEEGAGWLSHRDYGTAAKFAGVKLKGPSVYMIRGKTW